MWLKGARLWIGGKKVAKVRKFINIKANRGKYKFTKVVKMEEKKSGLEEKTTGIVKFGG